eukprot:XP_001706564.1 Hypothetical protein GL50803_32254 [Giardia lamblia ATCC 50803]
MQRISNGLWKIVLGFFNVASAHRNVVSGNYGPVHPSQLPHEVDRLHFIHFYQRLKLRHRKRLRKVKSQVGNGPLVDRGAHLEKDGISARICIQQRPVPVDDLLPVLHVERVKDGFLGPDRTVGVQVCPRARRTIGACEPYTRHWQREERRGCKLGRRLAHWF